MRGNYSLRWISVFGLALLCSQALAVTRVGNGDDGADLEGAIPLTEGRIFDARDEAVKLVRNLNTAGVPGLGKLLPELLYSPMYLAKKDVKARLKSDQADAHHDAAENVYARTFAESHASTRFFPAATKLDKDQLVALHIHEALHRALPESIREDESKVAQITVAITTPDSTHDQVAAATASVLPHEDRVRLSAASAVAAPESDGALVAPGPDRLSKPSQLGYRLRVFGDSPNATFKSNANQVHSLYSTFHPFGGRNSAFGMAVETGLVKLGSKTVMGPLFLGGDLRLWTIRDFDFGLRGGTTIDATAANEIKNGLLGRDIGRLSLFARKTSGLIYVDNNVSVIFPGKTQQTLGVVTYDYEFKTAFAVDLHLGASLLGGRLRVGAFGEYLLSKGFTVGGGAFPTYDTGAYRIVSAGPEAAFELDDLVLTVAGRWIVSTSEGISYDTMADLFGSGAGSGGLTGAVSVKF